ncbi:MAG: Si-specific NAD(P)(+) transhydrogenase [Phycisphaerales bacterium]
MSLERYDLAVIGSGPAGQKAAIAATKLGRRVAIIDGQGRLGGVCLKTGTIPSKTLREAVLYLTGFRQRTIYGKSYRLQEHISTADLDKRVQHVIVQQQDVVHDQLRRNDVEILEGFARFTDPNTIEIANDSGRESIESDFILIACGTRPARRADIPFDHPHVMDADQLYEAVHGRKIARSCIVVGAGVIGLEYAAMMAALGMTVTVIDMRKQMLDFVDREMIEALAYHMRRSGVTFRLGETVNSITVDDDGMVAARLESGKVMTAERLLYAVGRQPNTDNLNIEAASLTADNRGRLSVNEHGQTDVPHIYAAGDVIGFPALASTSMEQGRLAACHMFGEPCNPRPELLPYGIYTIPEISMVGRTESQLTAEKIPWKVGLARFEELAKAQIIGDETGLLKLIFEPTTLKLLGVHIIGEGACELVHIGQLVMASEGTMETLRDTVFNYPTLAEAYKVAALDGLNKVGAQHTHATA